MVTLTILGCSGSYPGPEAACSGYLVQGGGVSVAVDLGPGTLSALQHHIPIADLDAVVLSHAHPDHWIDLSVLKTAWKWGLGRTGLPVFGTDDNRARAEAVDGGLAPTFEWTDIGDGERVVIGGLQFSFARTEHYVETLAVRVAPVDGGPAIGYSADTGPGWSFSAFGDPLALALCEASHLADGEADGVLHLSARQAGAMARSAGAERLVLTHLVPGCDPDAARAEAEAAYGAPVTVARPHQIFEV